MRASAFTWLTFVLDNNQPPPPPKKRDRCVFCGTSRTAVANRFCDTLCAQFWLALAPGDKHG